MRPRFSLRPPRRSLRLRPSRRKRSQPDADRNPWTNQPNYPAGRTAPSAAPQDENSARLRRCLRSRPCRPATPTKPSNAQEQLYTYVVHPTFVQFPVTVKDNDGRRVDGLLPTDFIVKENGMVQKLSFFTQDPFALSVAIVLDLGMPDSAVQKVNQTFPALMGAFAPYDEVALYTYSSTVSEVSDFTAAPRKADRALEPDEDGTRQQQRPVPVLSGPLAPNGPIINGIPVGSPTQPVYTPPERIARAERRHSARLRST